MDRVDYHLERLLPSLQLLTSLSLFTPLELQSITQQRRNHELHLISRGVSLLHYLEYIALEESFEKLTSLRVGRAGKDERGNDVVSLKDRNKLRRFQERQLLSVWQRMVTKLGPRDPDVFLRYLTWLQGRKMRRVYSQIAAQALSLHPSHVDLWIHVADWELNANLDASAARLTLLRAIRLNTRSSGAAPKRRAAVKAKEGRRRKRQRAEMEGREESDEGNESEGEVEDAGIVEEEQAPQPSTSSAAAALNIPAALTPSSRDLLALWLAYLRMECVFLERLRRRWALLGVTGGADATQAVAEEGGRKSDDEGVEGDDDEEDVADGAVSNGKSLSDAREDAAASAANESAKSTAPTKILSGALPLAIISSALGANPASSAPSPSLPQDLKLLFTLVVLRLLLSFPFETREKADGEELRTRLVESVLTTFEATCGGASALVRRVTETTASTRFAAYRRLVLEDEESRPQEDVDRRRNDELRAAAKLVMHSQRGQDEVSAMVGIGAEPEEDEDEGEVPSKGDRAVRALLAQVVEDIRRTQTYAQATAHRETAGKIKVGLANAIKALLHNDDGNSNLPRVKLAKAVCKSLAYQHREDEDDEGGGEELRPTQDPLLPYVSALLERALRKQQDSPQALLLFRRLALQHETDLFTTLEDADENAASALYQKWKDLDDQAAQKLASQPYPRTLVWTSRWAFEQAQRVSGEAEGHRNIPEQLEQANDFWLAQLRALDPEKKKRSSGSTSASATCRFITTLLLPWARTEHEEGRGIYVDVVERSVTLSRRLLLVARAESNEAREEMQRCHDEALLCLFTLLGKEEVTMDLWKDGKKASPSLGAWMKLLPLLQDQRTTLAAAQHVQRLALQLSLRPSQDDVESSKSSSLLLDVFTALFETYLMKMRDVQGGVGLLQKAKRCAGGGEEWGRRVEGRWEEVARRAEAK